MVSTPLRTELASGVRRPSSSCPAPSYWPQRSLIVVPSNSSRPTSFHPRAVAACVPLFAAGFAVVGGADVAPARRDAVAAGFPAGPAEAPSVAGAASATGSSIGDGSVLGLADDAPTSAASRLGPGGSSLGRRVTATVVATITVATPATTGARRRFRD